MPKAKVGWYTKNSNFMSPDELPSRIKKSKYREFLLRETPRPKIKPDVLTKFILQQRYISDSKLTIGEYLLLFTLDKYEFFTIAHVTKELNNKTNSCTKVYLYNLVKKGLIYQMITDWHLDDKEYKQRFGEESNRHQYRKRYALTMAGTNICHHVYSLSNTKKPEEI